MAVSIVVKKKKAPGTGAFGLGSVIITPKQMSQ